MKEARRVETARVAGGPRRRSNWHALIFGGSLVVAMVAIAAVAASKDGRVTTLLDRDARNMIRRYHRVRGHAVVRLFPSLFQYEVAPDAPKPSKP